MQYHYLYHSGILGMKWGVRRYQNPDGTLTPEGRLRYGKGNKNFYVKKDGSYRSNETRQAIKKDIKFYENKAGAYGLLGGASLATLVVAGMAATPLAAIATQGAFLASFGMAAVNNFKSMKLSNIKQNADIIDFHRDNNTAPEPFNLKKIKNRSVNTNSFTTQSTDMHNMLMQQQQFQSAMDTHMQQVNMFNQQAIVDANRTASLGITNGMNPFLFG